MEKAVLLVNVGAAGIALGACALPEIGFWGRMMQWGNWTMAVLVCVFASEIWFTVCMERRIAGKTNWGWTVCLLWLAYYFLFRPVIGGVSGIAGDRLISPEIIQEQSSPLLYLGVSLELKFYWIVEFLTIMTVYVIHLPYVKQKSAE